MAEPEHAPVPAGGAPSALDPKNPKDRALLRTAMSDWPRRFRAITPEKRDNWVNDLEDARSTAKLIADSEVPTDVKLAAVQVVNSCVKTSAMLDRMQQIDELSHAAGTLKDLHHTEKQEQAERHHQDDMAAGRKQTAGGDVRILIVDARSGAERQVPSLLEFYRQAPATLALPDRDAGGPVQAEGGQGGAPVG